jgi:hypothetical protein
MGSKISKKKKTNQPPKLTNRQCSFLEKKTNLSRVEIKSIFNKF